MTHAIWFSDFGVFFLEGKNLDGFLALRREDDLPEITRWVCRTPSNWTYAGTGALSTQTVREGNLWKRDGALAQCSPELFNDTWTAAAIRVYEPKP